MTENKEAASIAELIRLKGIQRPGRLAMTDQHEMPTQFQAMRFCEIRVDGHEVRHVIRWDIPDGFVDHYPEPMRRDPSSPTKVYTERLSGRVEVVYSDEIEAAYAAVAKEPA